MSDEQTRLAALAGRLADMRAEKRYLEGEIEKVSALLAEALGPGSKHRIGNLEVRVAEPRPGLRILEESSVPEAFLTRKPDRRLLLEHVRLTGEVPGGVEVTEGRATVYTKELASEAD